MFGMYGRCGIYGMNGGIVWMVGMVCKSVGYGMFDMTACMVCMAFMVTMMGMESSYVR